MTEPKGRQNSQVPPHSARLTRRRFLRAGAGAAAACFGGTAVYAYAVEPLWVQVVRRPMPLAGLGPALTGYRIVQISDLHCSQDVSDAHLTRCMDLTNACRPDLVVVTGDLVTRGERGYIHRVSQLLQQLHAPDGVVAILGNHDYRGYGRPERRCEVAEALVAGVEAAGVRVLRNARTRVVRDGAGLTLVGLDDYWWGGFDVPRAFAGVGTSEPVIALTHNPDSIFDLRGTPAQWVLAGHTHGGQVSLPFYGAPLVPVRHKELQRGHYTVGRHNLYINRGLGWLKRVRFLARPEITVFELQPV